jgi:H+/Cl- antiporter ClcA
MVLGAALVALASVAGDRVLGSGNAPASEVLAGSFQPWCLGFPLAKMASTLLTYWSGIAGGIFAPCLSIGAALGADAARLLGASTAACALVGMAAFLSGTIQAPITAFVIIFEMTGHHALLLPIMLASLLAFMVARLSGAEHLYQALSRSFERLLV